MTNDIPDGYQKVKRRQFFKLAPVVRIENRIIKLDDIVADNQLGLLKNRPGLIKLLFKKAVQMIGCLFIDAKIRYAECTMIPFFPGLPPALSLHVKRYGIHNKNRTDRTHKTYQRAFYIVLTTDSLPAYSY